LRFIILNKYRLITFNKNTFFKNTYCEFLEVNHIDIEEKIVIRANITVFIFLQKKESTENQTIGEELPLVGGN
jgi:hypothetical protein